MLAVTGGYASLQDISGKHMGRIGFAAPLLPGSTLSIGGKDVEIDSTITKAQFLAGKPFLQAGKPGPPVEMMEKPKAAPLKPVTTPSLASMPKLSMKAQMKAAMLKEKDEVKKTLNVAAPKSAASKQAFKNPLKDSTVMAPVKSEIPVPRHDPKAPGALIMKRPSTAPNGRQIVDVVLDPLIGKHLREHQREGVKFLYECVMGLRDFDGEGCILADEMGLGKTLQTIALLWTLLKQNSIAGAPPVVKKALIVCPVTLITNWQKEFRKWLGNDRVGVFIADGKKTRLTDFTMGKSYSIMIIGYERLRTVAEDLAKGSGIDIVVADEGHRLKTVQNKSAQAIQTLNTQKRIILSGTPIQNDLSEFFAMVNFVNDGLLGTSKSFMKTFEDPIVKSRQPNASEKAIELGEARGEELAQSTSPFILRRTADILSKYLPPKTEYVLFCNPTPTQANIYRNVLASPMFQFALGSSESALQLITILKKLCNSPSLLSAKSASGDEYSASDSMTTLLSTLPPGLLKTFGAQSSTKIRVLDQLLYNIHTKTDDKVVLVSNYTSTLDLLQTLLTSLGLPFLRLDGSTPASKRHGLVDDFNRSPSTSCFAFLLSAKAGGLGLNLIGGSRLMLFDVDWNPATDEQAMARIHREGQRKRCRIYRFVVKGGLEERIWQRQVVKRGLADSIMDGGGAGSGGGGGGGGKKGVAQFSREELRDLFRLDEREGLRTHDVIGCGCDGSGVMGGKEGMAVESVEQEPFYVEAEDEQDEDDTNSLPDIPALVKASSLSDEDILRQERRIASGTHPAQARSDSEKKQKQKPEPEMQSLMQYAHIDVSRFADLAEDGKDEEESEEMERFVGIIDDECLMDVLRGDGGGSGKKGVGGVSFVFVKTSKSKVLEVEDEGGKRYRSTWDCSQSLPRKQAGLFTFDLDELRMRLSSSSI